MGVPQVLDNSFDTLGILDRVASFSQSSVDPCIQKALTCATNKLAPGVDPIADDYLLQPEYGYTPTPNPTLWNATAAKVDLIIDSSVAYDVYLYDSKAPAGQTGATDKIVVPFYLKVGRSH